MRRALAEYLQDSAAEENLFFLTGDLGFQVFDSFREKHPDRYLNVGISEAALIGIAAGLSYSGYTPVTYSIASFLTSRAYEQMRFFSGYNEMKIVNIGAGGGLAYSLSGSTHHALDDIGLAALIPGLKVYAPTGPNELKAILNQASSSQDSSYIQIGKFGEEDITPATSLKGSKSNSRNIGVISSGTISTYIRNNLIDADFNSTITHLHVGQISPLIHNDIIQFVNSSDEVICVDEQLPNSGLYVQLLRFLNENDLNKRVHRLGSKNGFIHTNRSLETNRQHFGYDWNAISSLIKIIEKK
jgi:transketolase